MKIQKLRVTQAGLRNQPQLNQMIEFIKADGRFNQESIDKYCEANPGTYKSGLIQIALFPDGETFISDGHHRALAIALAGRDELYEDEYFTVEWSYAEYLEINFDHKWVTPFDPRTHVRLGEFFDFKQEVYKHLEQSEASAIEYIEAHPSGYCKPRTFDSIEQLRASVKFLSKIKGLT